HPREPARQGRLSAISAADHAPTATVNPRMRSETPLLAAPAPDPRNRSAAALAHRVLRSCPRPSPPQTPTTRRKSHKPMSKPTHRDPVTSIDPAELSKVGGGASRVTARSNSANDQLTAMLTQITNSIQQLSQNNNQSDPMQMMLMMMMMGGMGGGG